MSLQLHAVLYMLCAVDHDVNFLYTGSDGEGTAGSEGERGEGGELAEKTGQDRSRHSNFTVFFVYIFSWLSRDAKSVAVQ